LSKTSLKILVSAITIIITGTIFPQDAPAEPKDRKTAGGFRFEIGLYPSLYRFDSSFFGAEYAPGIDARASIRLLGDIYFENVIGLYTADTDDYRLEGFKDQINVRFSPVSGFMVNPELTLGIAIISANPAAETVTKEFRPTQTAFYLSAGAGASFRFSKRIVFRGGVTVMATPYRYRIYSYDRESIDQEERQLTNINLALGASYLF